MLFACCYNYNENFDTIATTTPALAPTLAPVLAPVAPMTEIDDIDDNKYNVTEGFDILGTEQTLLRGKKSNTIMVNEDMRKSKNVDPYDGWNNQTYFTSIN
jgi:hypothetical protein